MPEPATEYVSITRAPHMRRQAWNVWSVAVAITLLWAFLIILAPTARLSGAGSISEPLYHFFSFICHQIPSRTFHINGEPFGVCSRCSGIYFGLLVGVLIYPLWRRIESIEPIARIWLFLSLIPVGIDWSLTVFGIWENTFTSRFITGLILGIACATFIVPAAVEILRNLTYRRHASA